MLIPAFVLSRAPNHLGTVLDLNFGSLKCPAFHILFSSALSIHVLFCKVRSMEGEPLPEYALKPYIKQWEGERPKMTLEPRHYFAHVLDSKYTILITSN